MISWAGISLRGQAILRLVGIPISQGYSEREIASRLGISKLSVCDLVVELQDELRRLAV